MSAPDILSLRVIDSYSQRLLPTRKPEVRIEFGGERPGQSGDHVATAIDEFDHQRVLDDERAPALVRFLMGFPPRTFVTTKPMTPTV